MASYQIDENKNLVEPSGKVVKKVFNFTIGNNISDTNYLSITYDQEPSILDDFESGKLMMVALSITNSLNMNSYSFVNVGNSGLAGSFTYLSFTTSTFPLVIAFSSSNDGLFVDSTVNNRTFFINLVKGQSGYLEVYTLE